MNKKVFVLLGLVFSLYASDMVENNSTVEWGEETIFKKTWPDAVMFCTNKEQKLPSRVELGDKYMKMWDDESGSLSSYAKLPTKCVKNGSTIKSLKILEQTCQDMRTAKIEKEKERQRQSDVQANRSFGEKVKNGLSTAGDLAGKGAMIGAGVFFAMSPASAQAGSDLINRALDINPADYGVLDESFCSDISAALQKIEPKETMTAVSQITAK
jgi:hypothetical protein